MRYELNSAYSMQNGIGFFSNVHSKMIALTTIGDDNTISTEWIKTSTLFKRNVNAKMASKSRCTSGIIDILAIPINFIVIFIALQLLKRTGIFNIAQYLVTSKPSDKHLIVAIEGLKYWLQKEEEKDENIA